MPMGAGVKECAVRGGRLPQRSASIYTPPVTIVPRVGFRSGSGRVNTRLPRVGLRVLRDGNEAGFERASRYIEIIYVLNVFTVHSWLSRPQTSGELPPPPQIRRGQNRVGEA